MNINPEELKSVAQAAKEAVESVRKAHQELDGRVEKLQGAVDSARADAVDKAAFQSAVERVEKAEQKLDTTVAELNDLAKKAANVFGQAPEARKSLGQMAAESKGATEYRGGTVELCEFKGPAFAKAMVSTDAASAGAFLQPHRAAYVEDPLMPVLVRDLFANISIATNAIEWVREKAFTNNAGPQATEGAAKNESAITFEAETTGVKTLAHWIPASRQVLADIPALAGMIDRKLRYGLALEENRQLLKGDGTGGNILGLIPQATTYVSTGIPATPTKIDHLRWAALQVSKALYPATFYALSLEDWAAIQMQKTTDGAYIFGSPSDGAAPRLWGKRVVETSSLATTEFLCGSALAATIWDRESVSVRVAEQHADFFIKNMVAILCEERLALTVERPAAIVAGTFA